MTPLDFSDFRLIDKKMTDEEQIEKDTKSKHYQTRSDKRMSNKIQTLVKKVFCGQGFLTNDSEWMRPSSIRSHIYLINPLKQYKKTRDGFYDKERIHLLIDLGIDITTSQEIVVNEYTRKIVSSTEELYKFIKTNAGFHYIKYAPQRTKASKDRKEKDEN